MEILLIGCGNMGSAMLHKWLESGIVKTAHIVSPSGKTQMAGVDNVHSYTCPTQLPKDSFDMILYAAKPQMITDILPQYSHLNHNLFVSVAAGKTIESFQKLLGDTAAIIRVMPNTASQVGQGVSPAFASKKVRPHHKETAQQLMECLGAFGWLQHEDLMHSVTALSGSGIAYVFYFMECLEKHAIVQGLDTESAKRWAIQTVLGGATLATDNPQDLSTLRQAVVSPNGTTAAALQRLMDTETGLDRLIGETMENAKMRSIELSK